MLLVIDVGNTNTVLGVYEGETLSESWRISSLRDTTADEFNVLASNLFATKGLDPKQISKVIISSVVPAATRILNGFCCQYLKLRPFWVTADSVKKRMPILYTNPNEVGADRIVNAVAAYEKYRQALIIIDFGTATTFDVISSAGEYLGGAIAPGIMISAEALFQKASRLPRVEIFQAPTHLIGKDTIESMQAGIIHGSAAMVDGMITRMIQESNTEPKVIATGGLAHLIMEISEQIHTVDDSLTLDGLRIIASES